MIRFIRRTILFLALSPLYALAAPISLVDDAGKTVNLPAPAQRIVALAPHVVETLYVAGAGNQIVGTVEYSDYPQSARSIRRIGNYSSFDLEALLALKPDLVIGWETGNSPSAIEKIRDLGIPVYLSQPNRITQIGDEIETFGKLAGTERVAKPAADAFRKRLDRLEKENRGRPQVSVFYQISDAPLMTIGGKQIISNALSICGGRNIFEQLAPMAPIVSAEAVIAANPEVIMTSGMEKINPAALDTWKKWPQLTATQRRNFFLIDSDLINRNGPRILDGTQQICNAIQTARNRRPANP
jgi:iron complex transport system substrate-binding protein